VRSCCATRFIATGSVVIRIYALAIQGSFCQKVWPIIALRNVTPRSSVRSGYPLNQEDFRR
jgi:hypothetical protein